ncbi:MAG: PAS domain S-box protein [Chloroflexota bacterium]|nr:PAS domain S-box protein [Chloroflexota bacterium]
MELGGTIEPSVQTVNCGADFQLVGRVLRTLSWDVLQNLSEAMLYIDLEGRIIECNQTALNLSGYSRDELIGRSIIELVHPDDRETALAAKTPVLTGYRDALEIRVVAKDGACLTVSASSTPLRDQGRTVGLIIVGHNITDLKTAHLALEQGNLDLLFLNEVSQAVTSTLDLNEVLTKLMARINDVLGMEAASILLVDESSRDLVFATAAGGGAEQVKGLRLQPGQGIAGWVAQEGQTLLVPDVSEDPRFYPQVDRQSGFVTRSVLCVPLKVKGRVVGVIEALNKAEGTFTARDRRLLEAMAPTAAIAIENARLYQALRTTKEFNESIVQGMTEGLLIEDEQGRITFVNPRTEAMLGYAPGELMGRHWTDIVSPVYLQRVEEELAKRTKGISSRYEAALLSKSGREILVLISVRPQFATGHYVGALSVFTDVTERKQLEEQLRRSQKMEALGTLAGGIAHDFNNILGGILGYASFIRAQMGINDPFRSDVETIIHSVQRAAELTNQLLTFARGSRPETCSVNLCDSVREVVKLLERTIDRSIAIKLCLDGELIAVEGDAAQLQQMLLNLCLNSRDAMPAGGILTIEARNVSWDEKQTIPDLKPGDYVYLSVTDSGVGMDADTLSHLFEPFFTTKREQVGNKHSGLGLAMVYSIVRNHNGVVYAGSELGQGSTFHVYLPASTQPVSPTVPPVKVLSGGTETILVVDDEEIIRDAAQRILCSAGYTVLTAENGRQAVEVFRRRHEEIGLVILDIIMPEMGGEETFIRLQEIDHRVQALLTSGYSQEGRADNILRAGARGFLQKPYTAEDVLYKVRVVLDGQLD